MLLATSRGAPWLNLLDSMTNSIQCFFHISSTNASDNLLLKCFDTFMRHIGPFQSKGNTSSELGRKLLASSSRTRYDRL